MANREGGMARDGTGSGEGATVGGAVGGGQAPETRARVTTRSQISITLLFFTLFLIVGHLGIWFVLFPVDPDARLLGFPLHYALALLAGWPVLLVLVAVYARIANRLDDRIGGGDCPQNDSPRDDSPQDDTRRDDSPA